MEFLKVRTIERTRDELDLDDVNALMDAVDDDGDGMIDITEFYDSMESPDDHDEAVGHPNLKRVLHFWQTDDVQVATAPWPYSTLVLHLIALVLVNALFGPVDGMAELCENLTTPASYPVVVWKQATSMLVTRLQAGVVRIH